MGDIKETKKFMPYKVTIKHSKSFTNYKRSFILSEEKVPTQFSNKDFEARMIFDRIDQEILTYNDNLIEKIQLEGFIDNEFEISSPIKTLPNKKTVKKESNKKDVINSALITYTSASKEIRKNASDDKYIHTTKNKIKSKLHQYINKPLHSNKKNDTSVNGIKHLSKSIDKGSSGLSKNKLKTNSKLYIKSNAGNLSYLKNNSNLSKNGKTHFRTKSFDAIPLANKYNKIQNKKCNYKFITNKINKSIDRRMLDLETMFGKSLNNVDNAVNNLSSEDNMTLIKNLLALILDLKKDNNEYKLKTEKELNKKDNNSISYPATTSHKRSSSMDYSQKNDINKNNHSNTIKAKKKNRLYDNKKKY